MLSQALFVIVLSLVSPVLLAMGFSVLLLRVAKGLCVTRDKAQI